ncbi:hypothetical protein EMB92_08735 [Bifidobacterium callitrichos]|uniref:Uncharacterized protein n=1 Tax=Bifidobacterium callitrichos TaxID=762209 RepID=A0A5M9ZBV2_9BIFI|nr:hypothetical protein [Bifidobacterium callitrichos]KAA8816014.1 hypothetical protein EMB92_08735 [Bifidobacterium callitrichos]
MVNAHIKKITAVIALLAAVTSLSACGTHSQSASPTLADHSAETEQTSGNNKASSSSSNTESSTDSTDNETVVCKAAVDSAVKSYQQVKDEIESANHRLREHVLVVSHNPRPLHADGAGTLDGDACLLLRDNPVH